MNAIRSAAVLGIFLASAPATFACTGDCNRDRIVTVDEIIQGVNIALGSAQVAQCEPFDADGGGAVTVDEIVAAVSSALNGCPTFAAGMYSASIPIEDRVADVEFSVAEDGDITGELTTAPASGLSRGGNGAGGVSVTGTADLSTGRFSMSGTITLPGQSPIAFSIMGTLPSAQGSGGAISIMIGPQTYIGSFSNPSNPTPTPTTVSSQHNVFVGQTNLPFDPELIEINPGDTVVWMWVAGTHSVRSSAPGVPGLPACSPDGRFDSGPKSSGTFSYTFTTPGIYEYHCAVGTHCQNFETGIVIVRGTPTATATITPTSTPPPTPTPTATATAEVVDGVSRGILGTFEGEFHNQFGGAFPARLFIEQTGPGQVRLTDVGMNVFGSMQFMMTATTPTRISYVNPDPFNMQTLTLELVGPGHLTGTYIISQPGMGMFTNTLDLTRVP